LMTELMSEPISEPIFSDRRGFVLRIGPMGSCRRRLQLPAGAWLAGEAENPPWVCLKNRHCRHWAERAGGTG
jgi:hypothetical protein